ncbi:phosphonate metabolism transcriptional regulator PhnF [Curtobacterium sp. VKM Ac-2865]|uniref:phosphonate metabolism transcriptional regulator PhnF n=1 Tax=Curtobacterium sp. VKM Ac-2865 TaxID=2783817 RepID=UPI00188ACD4C|nr:phosphonate metabolism transcriptional regulator PhnF [Curtobacterium sp. VKM Ac-2865]MBF4582779.1 phosphonate metabolism transcriptional regulator PhnF [Curtobacterium sp. VKM Ac-2865]
MTVQGRSASGYSAWRLIADELRREIFDGSLLPSAKLPTEGALAERFGVHRNTVRQAVAALASEDLVRSRRGSGTFVVEHSVIVHRIGLRTRLSDSLGRRGSAVSGRLLESRTVPVPPSEVDEQLRLEGRPALLMESARSVDGVTISRGTHWFDAERVAGIDEHFARTGSMTSALRAVGIEDYLRAHTTVGARIASGAESSDMALPMGTVVLVVHALDALPDGTPLQAGITRFRADRVELDVEHPDAGAGVLGVGHPDAGVGTP